jgi:hypothetical protein
VHETATINVVAQTLHELLSVLRLRLIASKNQNKSSPELSFRESFGR